MSGRPESLLLIRQWVQKADEDFRVAEHLLSLQVPWSSAPAAFHSQQCAEKYLKALLTLHAVTFPKSHDLLELLNRVSARLSLEVDRKGIAMLNRYSVEARYPGFWEPISPGEAEEAFNVTQTVRTAARGLLPSDVLAADG